MFESLCVLILCVVYPNHVSRSDFVDDDGDQWLSYAYACPDVVGRAFGKRSRH